MHPVHEVDAILLLSLSVAAKRRPAGLAEILAAIDLAHGALPSGAQLSKSFASLSAHGLIVGMDGGHTLSADAQKMMESQRKKDDTEKKILRLKEHLADYPLTGEDYPIKDENLAVKISPAQLLAAVEAYQTDKRTSSRNSLVPKPKPKPVWIPTKDLVQGKQHLPSNRRKPRAP